MLDLDFLFRGEEDVVPLDVQLTQTAGLVPSECSQDHPELVLGEGAGGEVQRIKVEDEGEVSG